ncbi:MAG: Cof-type HAD-IIB family hydrolase [Oscillospiraceae bacterium]|nr:Cof-type HAD-IIB family hydrolase [Oscillospiraceae bacterium]
MIKAIFFDVDGTLVSFQTHRASDAVLDGLARLREKGIKLFLATGRHQVMIAPLRARFDFDGYVTLSGQYCFAGGKILRRVPIEPAGVAELVAAAQSNAFSCVFLEGEEIYINCSNQYTVQFMEDLCLPMPPVAHPSRALEGELFQAVTFLTRDREHLLLDRAPHLKTTRWHPNFLDVIPSAGGKDLGMDAILEHFHIAPEEAMAFGDGENDLSMLRHAGIGVAMGSASEFVKSQADYVTGSVDEEGILAALTRFGLL